MCKIVAIMGSPHMKGNGSVALDIILTAARKYGAECVRYDLCKKNIKNCMGCRRCVKNGGMCVLEDDMKEIFENIKTADILIINSPIYINQVNGLTKTFLDRMYPFTDEHHKPRFGERKVIMLCTYGAPIPFIFNNYIKKTGRSLKAMGLMSQRPIIISGCTTQNMIASNTKLQAKLRLVGKKLAKAANRSL